MDATSAQLLAVFIGSSLRLAMPMLLAASGELVSERAGVLNLSIEGMMLLGAFAGAMGSLASGSAMVEGVDFMRATWSIWFGKIDQAKLGDQLISKIP